MRKRSGSAEQPGGGVSLIPPGGNLFRLMVNSVVDYGIVLLDKDGLVRSWNLGAERIEGYAADEVIGQHFSMFYPPDAVAHHWPEQELEIAAREGRYEDEGWRVRKDGTRFWANVVFTALRGSDGSLYGFAKITRDLTERKTQEDALRRSEERVRLLVDQVIRDPLTGAFNRRHLMEHLRDAIERPGSKHDALLVIDVDRFKSINDRFGHDTGDVVLTAVGHIARKLSRGSDVLFRMGGDEFVLYLPDVTTDEARQVAERLRMAVEGSQLLLEGQVSVSIGVTELRRNDSVSTWVQRADAALYQAKNAGRNRVVADLAA